jgi:hypothetical protein
VLYFCVAELLNVDPMYAFRCDTTSDYMRVKSGKGRTRKQADRRIEPPTSPPKPPAPTYLSAPTLRGPPHLSELFASP